MRKPRDIDAELRVLAEKRKSLVVRRNGQLGELVVATGADGLDIEVLAGALIAAVNSRQQLQSVEEWRQRGVAFFLRPGWRARTSKSDRQIDPADGGGNPAS